MFIALLAGGQMIRKMVKKSFALPDEQGLETFGFSVKSKMVRGSNSTTVDKSLTARA